ncbi:MAG: fumarylacetoacetate hydrolase family protein [Brevirhabdus sp.]
MKLLRFGETGQERPGILDSDGYIRDLSGVVGDIAGDVLSDQGLAKLAALDLSGLPRVSGSPRIGACVGQVGKILGIGLNYSDHAAEAGMEAPAHPILFLKATSAICGPDDDVIIPRGSSSTDWEVELGVVIGARAKHVSPADALSHVAGYCVANDVSERDWQMNLSGGWVKGKSADTFAPLGPWLVTRDEVPDPQALSLGLEVNGTSRQSGSTGKMIFTVAQIIAHMSSLMTLMPGDVILTGTPPGVGMGHKPDPIYLKPGDRMRLWVGGLGEQNQSVTAED